MAFWNKWFGKSGKQKAAEAEAATAREQAKRIAEAALVAPQDSDQARAAADRRLKKIGAMRGLAGTAGGRRGGGIPLNTTLGG
jgi:hypothetical protein